MNYHVKEADHSIHTPYDSKDAVVPEVGDIIKITLLDGKELTVVCVRDSNNLSGGYKGDTCQKYCALGSPHVAMCTHVPMKCRDDITFKNINEVLENL